MGEPRDPNEQWPAAQPWGPPQTTPPAGEPSAQPWSAPQSGQPWGAPPAGQPSTHPSTHPSGTTPQWPTVGGGQPGYPPQPDAPGYPSPYAQPFGQGVPAPPPRSRTRLIVVLSVVAVVVVAGGVALGIWLTGGSSTPSRNAAPTRIAVPSSMDGYDAITGPAADRVRSAMQSLASGMGGAGAKIIQAGTVGVYSDQGDQPNLIFFGITRAQARAVGATGGDKDLAEGLLSSAVPDSASFPAGSHGGAVRCGNATFGSAQETLCAWADSSTVGMLVSVDEGKSPADLAKVVNDFRNAID